MVEQQDINDAQAALSTCERLGFTEETLDAMRAEIESFSRTLQENS